MVLVSLEEISTVVHRDLRKKRSERREGNGEQVPRHDAACRYGALQPRATKGMTEEQAGRPLLQIRISHQYRAYVKTVSRQSKAV